MIDRDALRTKVLAFTGSPTNTALDQVDVTLLVHDDVALADGFHHARRLLAAGKSVHLFGTGASLPRTWPAWCAGCSSLWVTELGALRWAPQATATAHVQGALRSWVDRVVGEGAELPAARSLFTGACARFLQPILDRALAEEAATALHPRADLVHLERAGRASETLGSRRERTTMLAWGIGGLAASVVRLTRAQWQARSTLAHVRAVRAARAARAAHEPRVWFGLVPDWVRINHQLIDAVALPVSDREPIGILLVGSLQPGRRDDTDMRRNAPSAAPWPGLGELGSRLDRCVVEQAVTPASPVRFAASLFVGAARSARVLTRLALVAPLTRGQPSRARARALATWATVDVMRAQLAADAARIALGEHDFRDRDVVFVATNNPVIAPVAALLDQAGARTIQHEHGAGGDFFSGAATSEAAVRCLWTLADARSATLSPATMVAGFPLRIRLERRQRRPRNVLVLTNYLHADLAVDGRFPQAPLEAELLAAAAMLADDPTLTVRVRPHPAEDHTQVRALVPDSVEISRGRSLERDAEWADVVVSSMTTAVIELLHAGVPLFVHLDPALWHLPASDFLAPERVFYRAEAGVAAVLRWCVRWSEPGALDAERRARIALFGPTGESTAMASLIGRGGPR